MPRPRVPRAKADVTGYSIVHKERFRNFSNRARYSDPIGDAPYWMNGDQIDAWDELVGGLPWLDLSHRGITGIAAVLLARMKAGALEVSGMNLLRLCLGQMGATPADFAKVLWTAPSEDDDPADEFFR